MRKLVLIWLRTCDGECDMSLVDTSMSSERVDLRKCDGESDKGLVDTSVSSKLVDLTFS